MSSQGIIPCKHIVVLRDKATKIRRCATCNKIIDDVNCPTCGRKMSDLILLTTKSKYCKYCDNKKSSVAKQPTGEPANANSWIDELTAELDIDDFFGDAFDPNKP